MWNSIPLFPLFVIFIIYGYRKKIHIERKTMAKIIKRRSFYKLEVEEKGVYEEVYQIDISNHMLRTSFLSHFTAHKVMTHMTMITSNKVPGTSWMSYS